MKRLLMVTTVSSTLRAFLLPFADHFRDRGWQVDAMAKGISSDIECLQHFDHVWEIEWSRNPLDPINFLVAPQKIRQVVADGQYDIIHVHTPVAAFVSRYALNQFRKQGKCKVIYTVHGFYFQSNGKALKNSIFLTLEKLAGNWTDKLVVINHPDKLAAMKHKILPPQHIHYMPGIGVDVDYYHPNSVSEKDLEQLYEELDISPATPLFVCIAEFIARKRHCNIITAFAKLGRSPVHLVLAGDGQLFKAMQKLASDLGVEKQVHFLGLRKDIPTLIRASLACLLVSELEGLPRSVMESLCLETPVIGTRIPGTQDLLEAGCGLLTEVGDINGITSAMNWILDHPQAAQSMGKQGRELMEATYDIRYIINQHEALYAEVTNN